MRIRARSIALSFTGLLGLVAVAFWFVFLGPFGYEAPGEEALYGEPPHEVFVYGTLKNPAVRWLIIRGSGDPRPAVLPGHRREGLSLVREEGEQTEGLLLSVDTPELRRLDRYERLGVRYDRVRVNLKDTTEAWVYTRRLSKEPERQNSL